MAATIKNHPSLLQVARSIALAYNWLPELHGEAVDVGTIETSHQLLRISRYLVPHRRSLQPMCHSSQTGYDFLQFENVLLIISQLLGCFNLPLLGSIVLH